METKLPFESRVFAKNSVLTSSIIVTGHQPTLFPYAGFFYKMYHSHIMDLCPYDPFSKHTDRYQHRVKIGNDDNWKWFTLPIESHSTYSIMNVKLKTSLLNDRWTQLEQVYRNYPYWNDYKNSLKEIIFGYPNLWEINFRSILWVRDLLKIKTYLSISYEGKGQNTTERIASQFSNYGHVVYLAGKSTPQYLDTLKYEKLTQSTVALVTYTPPRPFSTVSILTPLLMYPPEKVLENLRINNEPIEVIINDTAHFLNTN